MKARERKYSPGSVHEVRASTVSEPTMTVSVKTSISSARNVVSEPSLAVLISSAHSVPSTETVSVPTNSHSVTDACGRAAAVPKRKERKLKQERKKKKGIRPA